MVLLLLFPRLPAFRAGVAAGVFVARAGAAGVLRTAGVRCCVGAAFTGVAARVGVVFGGVTVLVFCGADDLV